jgi:hypothetical protein
METDIAMKFGMRARKARFNARLWLMANNEIASTTSTANIQSYLRDAMNETLQAYRLKQSKD